MRERPEPGSKRPAVGIERVRVLPQVQEHLLGHILGGAHVTDHPLCQPEHERRVLVVDLTEGRFLAGTEPGAHRDLPFRGPLGERARRLVLSSLLSARGHGGSHACCSPWGILSDHSGAGTSAAPGP